jgi:phenylpyruvate tautomerase PptA (4-oxalocrotonate tautomerase family)
MPTYTCTYQSGRERAFNKADIAGAIARAHSEVTGAPLYFAQVIFDEVPKGCQFVGGQSVDQDHIFVFGHIRAGRSAVDRKALINRLTTDVAEQAGVDTFSVWVYIHELPPAAMVEFGHILPEAGHEDTWESTLPEGTAARMRSINKPREQ